MRLLPGENELAETISRTFWSIELSGRAVSLPFSYRHKAELLPQFSDVTCQARRAHRQIVQSTKGRFGAPMANSVMKTTGQQTCSARGCCREA
jgi:hypothetical protein